MLRLGPIEVITLDSDDELDKCKENNSDTGEEEKEEEKEEDEECYVIRLQNIPIPYSETSIVNFFEDDENGEPVNVLLNECGVLIKKSGIRSSQAFVIFLGKQSSKKALLKNFQPMGTSLVQITEDSVLNIMFTEFSMSPRPNMDVSEEDNNRIVFCNLPNITTEMDIKKFLAPYTALVNHDEKHYRFRVAERDCCELVIAMMSKVAAFFLFMKRNGSDMQLGDELVKINLKMYGYCSLTEDDSHVPNLKVLLSQLKTSSPTESESPEKVPKVVPRPPLKLRNVVRRHPITRNETVIVLKNLPLDTTEEDIIALLGYSAENSPIKINYYRRNENSKDAQIVCSPNYLSNMKMDNIRSFDLGSNHVNIHMFTILEEY